MNISLLCRKLQREKTLTTWRPQIPNFSFLNTVIYFENKENFTDNITEQFTFNSLTFHLLAVVQLRFNLSSLSFALVLDVTKWLLKVTKQKSQTLGSSILLLPHTLL